MEELNAQLALAQQNNTISSSSITSSSGGIDTVTVDNVTNTDNTDTEFTVEGLDQEPEQKQEEVEENVQVQGSITGSIDGSRSGNNNIKNIGSPVVLLSRSDEDTDYTDNTDDMGIDMGMVGDVNINQEVDVDIAPSNSTTRNMSIPNISIDNTAIHEYTENIDTATSDDICIASVPVDVVVVVETGEYIKTETDMTDEDTPNEDSEPITVPTDNTIAYPTTRISDPITDPIITPIIGMETPNLISDPNPNPDPRNPNESSEILSPIVSVKVLVDQDNEAHAYHRGYSPVDVVTAEEGLLLVNKNDEYQSQLNLPPPVPVPSPISIPVPVYIPISPPTTPGKVPISIPMVMSIGKASTTPTTVPPHVISSSVVEAHRYRQISPGVTPTTPNPNPGTDGNTSSSPTNSNSNSTHHTPATPVAPNGHYFIPRNVVMSGVTASTPPISPHRISYSTIATHRKNSPNPTPASTPSISTNTTPNTTNNRVLGQAAMIGGYLMKRGRLNTAFKQRWCVLIHNRIIFYVGYYGDIHGSINVKNATVDCHPKHEIRYENGDNCFVINTPEDKHYRYWTMQSLSTQDKANWIKAITIAASLPDESPSKFNNCSPIHSNTNSNTNSNSNSPVRNISNSAYATNTNTNSSSSTSIGSSATTPIYTSVRKYSGAGVITTPTTTTTNNTTPTSITSNRPDLSPYTQRLVKKEAKSSFGNTHQVAAAKKNGWFWW